MPAQCEFPPSQRAREALSWASTTLGSELCLLGPMVNWLLVGAHGTSPFLLPLGAHTHPLLVTRVWLANALLQKWSRQITIQDSDERDSRCYTKVPGNISLPFSIWARAGGRAGPLKQSSV